MILGIDATNIRSGGGLTHLRELLNNFPTELDLFKQVIIWSNPQTLKALPNEEWMIKKTHKLLTGSFVKSFIFQKIFLSNDAKKMKCNLLFVPGGTFLGNFFPIVSMCQNMLPFERSEQNRFKSNLAKLKFKVLFFTQKHTFQKSEGLIFLSYYAEQHLNNYFTLKQNKIIIRHGINPKFISIPKKQRAIDQYTFAEPFRLLYVSILMPYKHQWNVAEAVIKMRKAGIPVALDLVGGYIQESLDRLNKVLQHDTFQCVKFLGEIPYEQLKKVYHNADGFVFASSCENLPIILIEAMTAGIPIAASNMGPIPEVLGETGFYFDPLNPESIYDALEDMLNSPAKRQDYAESAHQKSLNYTWRECAHETFTYLYSIAKLNTHENTK